MEVVNIFSIKNIGHSGQKEEEKKIEPYVMECHHA